MNNDFLLPTSVVAARNNAQQLKVIMNLPVRLTTENQVIDVLPLTDDPNYLPKRRRRTSSVVSIIWPTPNDLIRFFHTCQENDLLNNKEVAAIYQVHPRTIRSWVAKGILQNYRLAQHLTLYKRSELPSVEKIYGAYVL